MLIRKALFTLFVSTPVFAFPYFAFAKFAHSTTEGIEQMSPFDIQKIKIGGEIGRRIDITIKNNLYAIDIEKDFLQPFRDKKSGLEYIGLGKTIDAAVRLAYHKNDPKLIQYKSYLIDELIKTQLSDGYIGCMRERQRMWRDYGPHEQAYIIHALINDYRYFQNQKALEAAIKLGEYIVFRWPTRGREFKPGEPTTLGSGSAFLMLYEETKDHRFLEFAADTPMGYDHQALRTFDHPVRGHAYRLLARTLAKLDLYAIQPDQSLFNEAHKRLEFINNFGLPVVGIITGPYDGWNISFNSNNPGETCATRYFLALLDRMMRIEADARYGDIMERVIYNALFAAQSPDGRSLRYHTSFQTPRVYFPHDTYCCPCNFRRAIADLPAFLYYYHTAYDLEPDGVYVNLYTASEAELELRPGDLSVKITQQTDYPNSGRITITLQPSKVATFPLFLRIPRWCKNPHVKIKGESVESEKMRGLYFPDTFFLHTREWEAEPTVIELDFPMEYRFIRGRYEQENRVALLRGPIVYCLNPDRNPDIRDMDIQQIVLEPRSVSGPVPDDTIRPDGLACRVKAYSPGREFAEGPNLDLFFSEFPDPGGQATYFKVPVFIDDDELFPGPHNPYE